MSQVVQSEYSEILEKDDLTVSELFEVRRKVFSAEEEKAAFDKFAREVKADGSNKLVAALCNWVEGRLGRARELLGEEPSGPLGRYMEAEALLACRRIDDAIGLLRKSAEKIDGGHGYVLLARALRRRGDYDGAAEAARKGLAQAEGNADLHAEAGILDDMRSDYDSSVANYRKALELNSECVDALFRLAYLSDLHGDNEQALEMYQRCIRVKPVRKNALVNLGLLYEELDRQDDAVACFRLAVERDPTDRRALLYLRDAVASEDMYFDEEQQKRRERRNKILETPITDFELSVRSRNCLEKMDVHTLGDLTRISEQELLLFKNFGETSLGEIKRMMSSKNLHLAQTLEEAEEGESASSKAEREKDEQSRLISRPVEELGLSVRSHHCMSKLGIKTIGDLARKTDRELMAVKNFGGTSLTEVKKKLAAHGLSLPGKE